MQQCTNTATAASRAAAKSRLTHSTKTCMAIMLDSHSVCRLSLPWCNTTITTCNSLHASVASLHVMHNMDYGCQIAGRSALTGQNLQQHSHLSHTHSFASGPSMPSTSNLCMALPHLEDVCQEVDGLEDMGPHGETIGSHSGYLNPQKGQHAQHRSHLCCERNFANAGMGQLMQSGICALILQGGKDVHVA